MKNQVSSVSADGGFTSISHRKVVRVKGFEPSMGLSPVTSQATLYTNSSTPALWVPR